MHQNPIKQLDLSQNVALEELFCIDNKLTTLDLKANKALRALSCSENQIATLDLTQNDKITALQCSKNALTSLELAPTILVNHLDCSENQLTKLQLGTCNALTTLRCYGNQIQSANMDALINALPDLNSGTTGGEIYVANYQPGKEKNVCTVAHVAALVQKKWKAFYDEGTEYKGIDVSIEDVDAPHSTIVAIYTVEGKRIAELQAGVNIVVYSNGTTKKIVRAE